MTISKPRKKILVLGERGMLGHTVLEYFVKNDSHTISTIKGRWDDAAFKEGLINADVDFIINCIGVIPQHNPPPSVYTEVNISLPIFLETLGVPIIHPSTDCEFLGMIPKGAQYEKNAVRDADDEYGRSKATISKRIEQSFTHTKIIRTSIIGHELHSHVSLLEWFLNSEGSVNGFINHYWNGVTTLQWAMLCEELIHNWDSLPILNQYGTKDCNSKYDVLHEIKSAYMKDIEIIPVKAEKYSNKCLQSDREIPTLKEQLQQLRSFYDTNAC